mmetsp:Transcript_15966/g.23494  ORF Transcript_15966/g.23494 Transcript_15966/m.23494 type:complete len:207 (-) Transcript_15966:967-1587(-)
MLTSSHKYGQYYQHVQKAVWQNSRSLQCFTMERNIRPRLGPHLGGKTQCCISRASLLCLVQPPSKLQSFPQVLHPHLECFLAGHLLAFPENLIFHAQLDLFHCVFCVSFILTTIVFLEVYWGMIYPAVFVQPPPLGHLVVHFAVVRDGVDALFRDILRVLRKLGLAQQTPHLVRLPARVLVVLNEVPLETGFAVTRSNRDQISGSP